ncbi:MAG: hypothetical protein WCN98_04560 [Verrucomicrobiaceae bacterium]
MSANASTFLLPDSEPAWRLWRSSSSGKPETLDSPADCREGAKPVVVGLPATACRTVGLVLPIADPALMPSMIEAQLERRGIPLSKTPSPNFAWHLLGQDAAQSIVSVDVLAQPFPENLAVHHAANYTAALRLMLLPLRMMVVVEEQGLLVLAAGCQGKLWHSHIIGAADTDPEKLALEFEIAQLGIETTDGIGSVRGISLVGERLAPLASLLKKHTAIPIETIPALEPNRGLNLDGFQRLLPASVFEAQAAKLRGRRLAKMAMFIAFFYAVAFAACWWHLQSLRDRAKSLESDIAKTDAPANEVRQTAQRWHELEPAVDEHRYPMMQLSQITALMPPSGVVIKKFDSKIAEIEITGDARDAQTATQFFEDLKGHHNLSRYAWSMPVPTVREGVASFKIQGKLDAK